MNKQVVYGIIALIVLIIIGGVIYMQSQDSNKEASEQESAMTQEEAKMDDSKKSDEAVVSDNSKMEDKGQYSGESDIMGEVAVHEIGFNGTAFSPSQLTIKNGDIVVFKNNSDKDFWPASAMHPDHLIYPEFDAKKGIAPGGTYEFKFTKTGSWGFHDHLTPSAFGKITVE